MSIVANYIIKIKAYLCPEGCAAIGIVDVTFSSDDICIPGVCTMGCEVIFFFFLRTFFLPFPFPFEYGLDNSLSVESVLDLVLTGERSLVELK